MHVIEEYETKLDSKKRCVLRKSQYEYYHVKEYDNGRIVLEPRVLVPPEKVSKRTLAMMDESVKNISRGKAGKRINTSALKDVD